jgi:FG-GAP repeat
VRLEQDPEWRMGMKLSAIGYGKDMQPVASGVMTASGNRVEVRYGDTESSPEVTEWYLNGPLGLEQGFTLNRPPAGKKQSGSLVLTLTLSGDLTAVPNDNGREVRFQTTLGKISLRFRDLYVLDATGRKLPSRFILANNGYGIQVDDRSAVYPISIDPLLINKHQKLIATDGASGDEFGVSVSVSGDTAVVGAPHHDSPAFQSGSAYVFVRSGTTWTEEDKLAATDGAMDDHFGESVAVSGDTVVVGARLDDDKGESSGSAYVHESGTFVFGGTLSGKMFCDDGLGTGTWRKEKFKENATFIMGTSMFPEITADIQVTGSAEKFTMNGLVLLKNPKSGLLQLFGDDSGGGGSKELSLSGKIKLNKKTEVWVSLNGKFQYQDNGDVCTLVGKFKAK